LGTETSKTRAALLDAAERLMLQEGYAAVTSRRVAATAGLKPQLVHYYFRTMDDLFLALYRSRAELGLELHAQAAASDQPLWAYWDLSQDPRGTRLTMEFIALANHRKEIRAEITESAERFRADELKGIEVAFSRYAVDQERYPPLLCTVLMTAISQFLVIEHEILGMTTGHAATVTFVEGLLTELEGPRLRRASRKTGEPAPAAVP
jgi:AcrR family transcriptional regulator